MQNILNYIYVCMCTCVYVCVCARARARTRTQGLKANAITPDYNFALWCETRPNQTDQNYVDQADFEFLVILPSPHECWDYRAYTTTPNSS